MSKRGRPSKAWGITTLEIQCKNQNESILESGKLSKSLLQQMKFSAYFINFSVEYLHTVSFILSSVCKHGKISQ